VTHSDDAAAFPTRFFDRADPTPDDDLYAARKH